MNSIQLLKSCVPFWKLQELLNEALINVIFQCDETSFKSKKEKANAVSLLIEQGAQLDSRQMQTLFEDKGFSGFKNITVPEEIIEVLALKMPEYAKDLEVMHYFMCKTKSEKVWNLFFETHKEESVVKLKPLIQALLAYEQTERLIRIDGVAEKGKIWTHL